VRISDNSKQIERPAYRLRYFLPLGMLAALALFLFAALPQNMGGLVGFVTVVFAIGVDRFTRGSVDTRPRGIAATGYLAFSVVVFLGSLFLVITVARGDSLWAAVFLAGLNLVVLVGGAWIPNGRPVHQDSSDEQDA
jgi:hypothetical protein